MGVCDYGGVVRLLQLFDSDDMKKNDSCETGVKSEAASPMTTVHSSVKLGGNG